MQSDARGTIGHSGSRNFEQRDDALCLCNQKFQRCGCYGCKQVATILSCLSRLTVARHPQYQMSSGICNALKVPDLRSSYMGMDQYLLIHTAISSHFVP